jgi:chloride channel 7
VTPEVRKALQAEPFELHGVVLRTTLLHLIRHRIGVFPADPSGDIPPSRHHMPSTQRERIQLLEKLEQIPIKVPSPTSPSKTLIIYTVCACKLHG